MRRKESASVENLLEYPEQTAGRIMNPNVFALSEELTVGEAITELQSARDVEMVFYLYVVDVRRHLVGVVSLRRLLLVSPETPLKRIMTVRPDQRARRHRPGGGRATGRVLQPARDPRRGGGEQAGRRHHGRRRDRRHQGRGDRRHLPPRRRGRRRARVHARGRIAAQAAAVADREPGDGVSRRVRRGPVRARRSTRWWRSPCSCRSWPAWAATPRRRR